MGRRQYIGGMKVAGVSPKIETNKKLDKLKSIGFILSYEDVKQLRNLLDDALMKKDDWKELNLTGFRNTNQLTVTYAD